MIYLTGDVHNYLGPHLDELHCGIHEASAALRCARLAAEAGVRLNLFVTGRALIEATSIFAAIGELGNVELGGHGWDAFANRLARSLLWSLCGSKYGPGRLQRHEIAKTSTTFRRMVGIELKTWRGHAYYTDRNTYRLLADEGIRVVSDYVSEEAVVEEILPGFWSLPINTSPDHDNIEHGQIHQKAVDRGAAILRAFRDLQMDVALTHRQRIAIATRLLLRRLCDIPVLEHSGERMYATKQIDLMEPKAWEASIYRDVERQLSTVGFATLLVHPVCMTALDELATFKRIVAFCRKSNTGFVSDVAQRASVSGRDTARL